MTEPKTPDTAVMMCVRIERVSEPGVPSTKDKCVDCGVAIWRANNIGDIRPAMGENGQVIQLAVPENIIICCGPCTLKRAEDAGEVHHANVLRQMIEKVEGTDEKPIFQQERVLVMIREQDRIPEFDSLAASMGIHSIPEKCEDCGVDCIRSAEGIAGRIEGFGPDLTIALNASELPDDIVKLCAGCAANRADAVGDWETAAWYRHTMNIISEGP